MSNIHPTIEQCLIPFVIHMQTDTGERGFRMMAPDSLVATKEGIARLNIRDEEISPLGLAIRVEVTS